MIALRALDFIDDNNCPTPIFNDIVVAFGTDQYGAEVRKMVERTYPYVLRLDLTTATPSMFAQSFSDATSAREDSLRKCRAFFLAAAKDAGIEIGTRIENAKYPRNRSSAPRKPKVKKAQQNETEVPSTQPTKHESISNAALEYKLVDLMKEPDVGDEERGAIWTLIQYLTRKKQIQPDKEQGD